MKKTSFAVLMCVVCAMVAVNANGQTSSSATAHVNVSSSVAVAHQALTRENYTGTDTTAFVDPQRTDVTYQWAKNGTTPADYIAGANGSTLTLVAPTPIADNGTYYCLVIAACGTALSDPIVVTIYAPLVTTVAGLVDACPGGIVDQTGTATGGKAPFTYNWSADYGSGSVPLLDGDTSPGLGTIAIADAATTSRLVISPVDVADDADYTINIIDSPLVNTDR